MERKGKKGGVGGAEGTLEKDGWKQKPSRQDGRSRSKLIRENDNVQKEFSVADGGSS